jgi:uncharacterized protein (TIGR04255 family)
MTHGRLKKDDHLVEVLFELRYGSEKVTDDFVEKFYSLIEQTYPQREAIVAQFVKFEMRPEEGGWKTVTSEDSKDDPLDVVRYRFKNAEGTRICQLGNGILSINFLKYEGFDDFVREVSQIVEFHNSIFLPASYRRLGLRYMNHFSYTEDWNPSNLLAWSARVPSYLDQDSLVVSNIQQTLLNVGDSGFQNIVVAYPQMNQAQQSIILLDVENFLQFQQPVEPNLETLNGWMQKAHDKVWNAFIGALNPQFLEELQHGSSTKSS